MWTTTWKYVPINKYRSYSYSSLTVKGHSQAWERSCLLLLAGALTYQIGCTCSRSLLLTGSLSPCLCICLSVRLSQYPVSYRLLFGRAWIICHPKHKSDWTHTSRGESWAPERTGHLRYLTFKSLARCQHFTEQFKCFVWELMQHSPTGQQQESKQKAKQISLNIRCYTQWLSQSCLQKPQDTG